MLHADNGEAPTKVNDITSHFGFRAYSNELWVFLLNMIE
jgi:hypothetical protein